MKYIINLFSAGIEDVQFCAGRQVQLVKNNRKNIFSQIL